jgi:hypothetical protein
LVLIIFGGAGGLGEDETAADRHSLITLPAVGAGWGWTASVHQ